MKLIKTREQSATAGLPQSYREWWDLGEGYEIYVNISDNLCLIGVYEKGIRDITLEVARYLGIETKVEDITFSRPQDNPELYLVLGIDCVGVEYTKPENYKELLNKIEVIVTKYFKDAQENSKVRKD